MHAVCGGWATRGLRENGSHMSTFENSSVYISERAMLSEVGDYEPSLTWAWLRPKC